MPEIATERLEPRPSNPDFHDEVLRRLRMTAPTPAQMAMALAVLQQVRWHSIGPDLDVCSKTGTEIAEDLGIHKNQMAAPLALLEDVGAIIRTKDGLEKIICLSPEYVQAEQALGRYREITVPLFFPIGKYSFKMGVTNAKGTFRQMRQDLIKLLWKR